MNYTIRKANQDDMSDVLSLIKELALFEKEPVSYTHLTLPTT